MVFWFKQGLVGWLVGECVGGWVGGLVAWLWLDAQKEWQ